ncbi:MAG TPA: hypothetical protein DEQ38_14140 [Elusimicrobia bacterium]|nr:MAG: hypothetical protein A2089_07150 [Elusimicrobia bacterium GWD2_63_28]HCC49237.1 hypothetical protein [Elusimicrobiota bacterium]
MFKGYPRVGARLAFAAALLLAGGAGFAQTAAAPKPPEKGPVNLEKISLGEALADLSRSEPAVLADFYRLAGEAYLRAGKTDKAISLLDGYWKGGGSDPMLLSRLADLYTQREDHARAIDIVEKLVKDRPQEPSYQAKLTMLYRQKGDLAKAAEVLEKKTAANPREAGDWAQLAEVYREKGDSAKAEKALQKAIELEPRSLYYYQLARLRLRSAGLDPAAEVLKEGLRKLPQAEAELSLALCDLYAENGQKEKAEAALGALVGKTADPARKQELQRRLDSMKLAPPPADKAQPRPLPGGTTVQAEVKK